MIKPLKQLTCDQTCGFLIQSSDKEEIINLYMLHAGEFHMMKLSRQNITKKIRMLGKSKPLN